MNAEILGLNLQEIGEVEIKSEIEIKEENLVERQEFPDNKESTGSARSFKNELDTTEEKTLATTHQSTTEKSDDIQFENVSFYTSKVLQEKPINNSLGIFIKDNFQYERQRFHQDIFDQIVANLNTSLPIQLSEVQKSYIEHLRREAMLEAFNCSLCDYQTIHKRTLRSHLLFVHNIEMDVSWLKCNTCSYRSMSRDFIKTHWETVHKKRNIGKTESSTERTLENFECDLCSFQSNELQLFKTHKTMHKDPNHNYRFLCYVCDYGHTRKDALQKHLFKTHQIVTKGMHKLKENYQKCNQCEYQSVTKESLSVHLESHKSAEAVKWLKCTQCDFQTKHRMSLRYHIRNHTLPDDQLRRYMCEVCSKRFKQKSSLVIHMITHKSMEQVKTIFKCPQCPYQTKLKKSLNMHTAVHKEPEFVCHMCGHRSKRKDNYNKHLLTHQAPNEALQIFKCSLCPYESHIKGYFRRHIKKH